MRTSIGWTGRSMQSFATSPAVMMWKADSLLDPKVFSFPVDPFMELSRSGKQDTLIPGVASHHRGLSATDVCSGGTGCHGSIYRDYCRHLAVGTRDEGVVR